MSYCFFSKLRVFFFSTLHLFLLRHRDQSCMTDYVNSSLLIGKKLAIMTNRGESRSFSFSCILFKSVVIENFKGR